MRGLMPRVGYCKANTCPGRMWHFLTGIGQVSKLVLTILRQRNMWIRINPWAYTYVKRQQICFEHKGKTSLSTATSLIHCSTPTLYDISSSLLSTAHMILFLSFSCYTLEWDKTIFTIILTQKMLQKLTVPVVKSLLLNFHPLSNIMLCLK